MKHRRIFGVTFILSLYSLVSDLFMVVVNYFNDLNARDFSSSSYRGNRVCDLQRRYRYYASAN